MPLVNAKCTNCGAPLQVDNTHEAAVCQYCGSAFIVEKAIQNYNYHITNNITAQNVIVAGKGEMEKERLLQNAKTNEDFKEYNKAYEIYKQVSEDYPDDYRGWYGLASIICDNFTKFDLPAEYFGMTQRYMEKSIQTAPLTKKEELTEKWNKYILNNSDYLSRKKKQYSDFINTKKLEINELQERINESYTMINQLQKSLIDYSNKEIKIKAYFITALFFLAVSIGYVIFTIVGTDKSDSSLHTILCSSSIALTILFTILGIGSRNRNHKEQNYKQETYNKIQNYIKSIKDMKNQINSIKNKYKI